MLKQKALSLLARREHSRWELEQKLVQRGFALEAIAPILADLEQTGVLCDERFVGCYLRSRSSRGMGPSKILAELRHKGIQNNIVTAHPQWPLIDWQAIAQRVASSRFELTELSSEQKLKLSRFLYQRGFGQNEIHHVLRKASQLKQED